ncbi:hypothetical protein O3P69_002071 [Scylla paramamosain]|uniref:BHLH domain-containing protein n=1 Tax=Scylla paramamosain TaxID=85552 RepID=A0AAW0V500_SCYPA
MRQDSGRGSPSRGKYALRPRTARRLQQDRVHQDACIESGPKSKAPPLSRYRRKTANARERYRMRKINSAFDSLRSILPAALAVKPTSSSLTKITTLRLAARYIRALSKVLEEGNHILGSQSVDLSVEDAASSPIFAMYGFFCGFLLLLLVLVVFVFLRLIQQHIACTPNSEAACPSPPPRSYHSLRSDPLVFAARWCQGASASAPRWCTRVTQVPGRVRSRGLGSGESGALRRILGSVTNKPPRACPPPGSTIC